MKKKVCAYVRLSSNSKAQEHSYEFQKAYWVESLGSMTEYDFIVVYADKGISGKNSSKRPQFLKMINAAKKGLIDIIYCKSVQRFARNTSELLDYVRQVKDVIKATVTSVLVDVPLDELNSLDEEIKNLQREMMNLHAKKTFGRIIPDAYAKQGSKLVEKIDTLKNRKNEILEMQLTNEQMKTRLDDITNVLDEYKPNKEFNPYLFKKLIAEITINDRNRLTFNFKIGLVRTIIVPIK